jgi:hypothetical protein
VVALVASAGGLRGCRACYGALPRRSTPRSSCLSIGRRIVSATWSRCSAPSGRCLWPPAAAAPAPDRPQESWLRWGRVTAVALGIAHGRRNGLPAELNKAAVASRRSCPQPCKSEFALSIRPRLTLLSTRCEDLAWACGARRSPACIASACTGTRRTQTRSGARCSSCSSGTMPDGRGPRSAIARADAVDHVIRAARPQPLTHPSRLEALEVAGAGVAGVGRPA